MPKIRHLAIKTKDPERLAKFYEEVFGMKCIHSERSGAKYMSDGYLTLAILRNRGEAAPSGINHFGFAVEDLDDRPLIEERGTREATTAEGVLHQLVQAAFELDRRHEGRLA